MSSKIKTTSAMEDSKYSLVPKLRFPEFRGAEGWKPEPMGEIYSFKGNNSLSRDKLNYVAGSVKNIHYGDIHTKFSEHFDITKERVPFINELEVGSIRDENFCIEGDMVFADASEDLEDIGKSIELISLNRQQVVSGLHTILARPVGKRIALGFGGHLFKSHWIRTQIQREAQGAKVLGISPKRLRNLLLPLPPAIPEQQKIAECLSSLDELIAAQGRKVDALKTHKKGLMQQFFPSKDTTQPSLRFPAFQDAEEWDEVDFGSVIFFQEGPGVMAVDFHDEGVPLVRLSGLAGQSVSLHGCNYLDPDKVEKKWAHFRLEAGDILVSCSASFGRPTIVTDAAAGAIFYTGLIRFKTKSHRLDVGYLEVFLGSHCFLRQAESAAVGGGIKHFGPTHLRQMKVALPRTDEQQRIADCLTCLDDLITAQTRTHEALKTHKKALMQQLFPCPAAVEA